MFASQFWTSMVSKYLSLPFIHRWLEWPHKFLISARPSSLYLKSQHQGSGGRKAEFDASWKISLAWVIVIQRIKQNQIKTKATMYTGNSDLTWTDIPDIYFSLLTSSGLQSYQYYCFLILLKTWGTQTWKLYQMLHWLTASGLPLPLLLTLAAWVPCFLFPAHFPSLPPLLHKRKHPAFFFQLKEFFLESLLIKRFHKYSTAQCKSSIIYSSMTDLLRSSQCFAVAANATMNKWGRITFKCQKDRSFWLCVIIHVESFTLILIVEQRYCTRTQVNIP